MRQAPCGRKTRLAAAPSAPPSDATAARHQNARNGLNPKPLACADFPAHRSYLRAIPTPSLHDANGAQTWDHL